MFDKLAASTPFSMFSQAISTPIPKIIPNPHSESGINDYNNASIIVFDLAKSEQFNRNLHSYFYLFNIS
jgi:hypothetical protein